MKNKEKEKILEIYTLNPYFAVNSETSTAITAVNTNYDDFDDVDLFELYDDE
jgi:hypothetical protein